jgi:hypothetical protein
MPSSVEADLKCVTGTSHGKGVGRESLSSRGCETSRIPHFLDSRFTDRGEVFNISAGRALFPRNIFWCSFLLEDQSTSGPLNSWKDLLN